MLPSNENLFQKSSNILKIKNENENKSCPYSIRTLTYQDLTDHITLKEHNCNGKCSAVTNYQRGAQRMVNEKPTLTLIRMGFLRVVFSGGQGQFEPAPSYFKKNV